MTNGGGMHTQQGSATTTKEKPQVQATVRPAPEPPKDEPKKSDAEAKPAKS